MSTQKLTKFQQLKARIDEAKAYCDEACCEAPDCDVSSSDIQYLQSQINDMYQTFWNWVSNHMQGHLPALTSTEQLQRALKVLGLQDEYTVVPKTIYASDGRIQQESLILTRKTKG